MADLYLPVSGEIVEINEAVVDSPELVNSDPLDDGWLIKVRLSDPTELDSCWTPPPTTTCWEADRRMPYVPHSPEDIRAMLEVIGKDERRRSLRPPAGRASAWTVPWTCPTA